MHGDTWHRGLRASARGARLSRSLQASAIATAAGLALVHGVRLLASLGPATAVPRALGLLAGLLVTDLATGVLHWACDTWGRERTPWLGPSVVHWFQEHHRDPGAIARHDWIEVNGAAAVATSAAMGLLTLPPLQRALGERPFADALLWSLLALATFANQLHQWAHVPRPPRPVRGLQRWGLIVSRAHHARHHRAPHTSHYGIAMGWIDGPLDGLGLWRQLEHAVTFLTGAQPRADTSTAAPHGRAESVRIAAEAPRRPGTRLGARPRGPEPRG